jgi:zinc protease
MLFGGDPRFGQPEDVEAALEPDLDALRAWLEPHLQNSAMEITVVGDVETDTAIDAVASVFGALDERAGEQEVFDPSVIVTPEGESFTRRHEGPPDAGLAAGIWPMPVSRDQSAAEAGQLLADVMSLKLTEQVREAEGASYAAQSGLALIRDLPNFGGLYAFTDPAPERIDEVLGMYKSIAAQMREGEISEDEMTRARNPRLENLRQSREENPYWLNLLSESQMEPEVLDRHRTQIEAVEAVTIEDIQALAEDYLTEDAMTAFTVRPAEAS